MIKRSTASTHFLSVALIVLAGSLIFFSYTISAVIKMIPGILDEMTLTVDESKAIVVEIEKVRQSIPPILKETSLIRAEVKAFAPYLTRGIDVIEGAVTEIHEDRALIESIKDEVNATLTAIPPLLDRVEQIISQAEGLGENLSKGAVSGVVSGVITSPFTLISGLGKKLTGTSDSSAKVHSADDYKLIETAVHAAINRNRIGVKVLWDNESTPMHGSVTLKNVNNTERKQCRTVLIETNEKDKLVYANEVDICRNHKGNWYLVE